MQKRSLFLIPILFLGLSSLRASAGIVTPHPWEKHSVKVCWQFNEPAFKRGPHFDKNAVWVWRHTWGYQVEPAALIAETIKAAVTREYTIKRVGIEFTGFEPCRSGESSDAVLINFRNPEETIQGWNDVGGKSTITNEVPLDSVRDIERLIYPHPSGAWTMIEATLPSRGDSEMNKIAFVQSLEYTALHEFAHLAGLLHERGEDSVEFPSGFSRRVSLWDGDSITLYGNGPMQRYLKKELPARELSMGDRHALRCLYVYSEAEKLQKCRPDYQPVGTD